MADAVIEVEGVQSYVEVVDNAETDEVELTVIGRGAQGPAGPAGPPGGSPYTHDQLTPATTWTIVHNLNRFPSVTIVDSAGSRVEGDVNYVSANELTVHFASAFAGKAHLS